MPEVFVVFFILGLIFGAIYDFLRFFRFVFTGKLAAFFIDFLFFVIISNLFFIVLLGYNNGQVRMIYFMITLTGFLIYIFTIFRLTAGIEKFLTSPFRRFFKNSFKSIKKLLQFIKRVYYNNFMLRHHPLRNKKKNGDNSESAKDEFKTE